MKVLAFAGSSSKNSINKQLVTYATKLLEEAHVEILDLNDYEIPLFSEDKEKELGQPALAKEFLSKIGESDALIISFAEHNGSYSAAYKNLFDWCSRINTKVFQNKSLVLLATSPGPGGGSNVLAAANKSASFFHGNVKATLSIPSFYENFDMENKSLKNEEIQTQLTMALKELLT
ncbi:MAG: NADPH-dependent FMN reductase [Kiritimatiellae bacterium]|nr:NADPH-dependent FMN reductase [Kiritimatiellia bacterium]